MTAGIWTAYVVTALFGIPLFVVFRRFGWTHWWQISLVGMLVFATLPLSISSAAAEYWLGFLLPVGAASGWMFWFIGVRGNLAAA